MIVDEDICGLIAGKEGMPLDFVAKEFYLMELLRELSDAGVLKAMIFKGGTALNKIYLKENGRFSEDLDFDFVGKHWQETFKAITTKISGFESLETRRIIRNKVVQVDFLYKTAWGKKDRVRLDINVKPYAKTAENLQMEEVASTFAGQGAGQVQVYGINDLLARKMSALKDRAEGKDIFDVSNAIDLTDRDKLLRAISLVASDEGHTAKEFLNESIERIKDINYKKMRNITNPYIPLRNRPSDWKILADTLSMKLHTLLDGAARQR